MRSKVEEKLLCLMNQLEELLVKISRNEKIDDELFISLFQDLFFYHAFWKTYVLPYSEWGCYLDERIYQVLNCAQNECFKIVYYEFCNDLNSDEDCSLEDCSNLLGE